MYELGTFVSLNRYVFFITWIFSIAIAINFSTWSTFYSVNELHIFFQIINVILRIIYVVEISMYCTHSPLLKCKIWSTKAPSCAEITQNTKLLVTKGQINANPTEPVTNKRLPRVSWLIIIIFTHRQTHRPDWQT